MAKKKNYNVFELNGIVYNITERVREESCVRSIPYQIETYIKELDDGEICRDPNIQRTADQWCKKQKSKLIEAVFHNRPIGTIALANGRADSINYLVTSIVDGLQRSTALADFYHDRFALDKKAEPVICKLVREDGSEPINYTIDIAGKKYSQLPEALQKFFNKYRLDTYIYEGFTDEELDDIVFCMNNGKSPTPYQKIRFSLGSDNMRVLQPMCDSTLWEDVQGCKAKNDSTLACLVRTLIMMTPYNYTNLGSATMSRFVDDFDDCVKASTLRKLGDLVEQLAEIKTRMTDEELTKFDSVTIPHYIVNLDKFNSMNNNADYLDVLRAFWKHGNFTVFTDACDANNGGSGQYSADNIDERQYAIDDFVDEYLDNDDTDKIDNMNKNEVKNDEAENIDESGSAEDIDCGDNGFETDLISDVFDTEIVSEDSGTGYTSGCFESQNNENGNLFSGGEPTTRPA